MGVQLYQMVLEQQDLKLVRKVPEMLWVLVLQMLQLLVQLLL